MEAEISNEVIQATVSTLERMTGSIGRGDDAGINQLNGSPHPLLIGGSYPPILSLSPSNHDLFVPTSAFTIQIAIVFSPKSRLKEPARKARRYDRYLQI